MPSQPPRSPDRPPQFPLPKSGVEWGPQTPERPPPNWDGPDPRREAEREESDERRARERSRDRGRTSRGRSRSRSRDRGRGRDRGRDHRPSSRDRGRPDWANRDGDRGGGRDRSPPAKRARGGEPSWGNRDSRGGRGGGGRSPPRDNRSRSRERSPPRDSLRGFMPVEYARGHGREFKLPMIPFEMPVEVRPFCRQRVAANPRPCSATSPTRHTWRSRSKRRSHQLSVHGGAGGLHPLRPGLRRDHLPSRLQPLHVRAAKEWD